MTMTNTSSGKLLALDVSVSSIGIATCDPLRLGVRPLTTLERRSKRADFDALAQIFREQEAVAIICGLPLNMDGSEGERAEYIRKWAEKLAHGLRALLGTPAPIIFWDERLSTFAAREYLAESSSTQEAKSKQKIGEDAAAAAVILQSYLDARSSNEPRDYGRIDLPPKKNSSDKNI